jgi:tetratricopeptide (TPR) repeat protein
MVDPHRLHRWWVLCVLSCPLFLAPPLWAQDVDVKEEAESERPERQVEIDNAIKKAAQEADARKPLETREEVTYEQILADPDNFDLNFRYAKSQMAHGDLVGASATLERLLLINPDLTPIRLQYAIVLFRLDNLEEAERELQILREGKLPPPQRQQVEQYLRDIRRRRQRTHWIASTSAGWGFDTNRNASPSSKKRLSSDALVDLTGTSKKRRDTNVLLVESLDVTHDLGGRSNHQLIGSFDYFLGEQTVADDLDLEAFSARGGAKIHTPLVDLTPEGFANYVYLSRESFLRSQGVALRMDRPLGKRLNGFATSTWTREDFLGITENTTAPDRSGHRVSLTGGGRYALTPTMQVQLELGYENKDIKEAHSQYNAYEGASVTGSHTWLLGKGQFLLSSLMFGVNGYEAPNTTIAARKRRDEQFRVRLTYGLPVSLAIGEWLPRLFWEDLTVAINVEQFRSLSNITNYTYSNTKSSVIFTKRFEF